MILENPLFLTGLALLLPLMYNAYRAETFRGRFISVSYSLIVLTLVVAVSGPQIQQENATVEEERLVFLNDGSESMLSEKPDLNFSDVDVEERTIASGNSSRIEQSINAVLESNTTYLVHSDLQEETDFSGVQEAFRQADSELNFYRASMSTESSVAISGPSTAVPNSETKFDVRVQSTTDEVPRPEVSIDDQEVELDETEQEGVYEFSFEFSETGTHRVEASISDEDVYESNNNFYKTVKVIERPEVLFVGQEGSLGNEIGDYFDIEYSDTVPNELDQYYSVVVKEKIDYGQNLEDYIYDGNGLVYTGEGTMDILPTREYDYSQSTENPRIIIGIDNSQGFRQSGTECTVGQSIKDSKELGTSLVSSLASQRPESIVGAFAYNNTVWELGEPQPLSYQPYLNSLLGTSSQGGIPSIPVCGTAYQIQAIQASKDMIGDSPGNIILITDGKVPGDGGIFRFELADDESLDVSDEEYRQRALEEASSLNENVSLHTVAVGDDPDTEFLQDLASAGNGVFYDGAEEFYALENRFRGGGGSDRKGISIVHPNHFITDGLGSLSSTVTDIEDMKARPGARTLVQTSDDRAFLSVWRYGLGRVASFSGDGSNLENVMGQEPILFSRTLNWAVGNPERKNNRTVKVESARIGEQVTLEASYDTNGFVRVGENLYRASTQPSSPGFHDYFGNVFAYNYRPEIQDLGYREDVMERLASATGGEVYEESVEGLQENVKSREVESVRTVSTAPYFIALALILLLIQVGIRKSKGWM